MPPGLCDAFEPCSDIDPVAHQVTIAFDHHIAEMYPDAEFDAALGRQPGIALNHAVLHLDRATHGINHATELHESAVASALHDATAMHRYKRIDQVAAQRPERASVCSSCAPARRE
jgi:hypothetical protein